MEILLFSLVTVFLFLLPLFMTVRVFWVFSIRSNYIRKQVRVFMNERINRHVYFGRDELFFKELDYYYFKVLWDFNKMMFHFWIWKMERMVNDREAYRRVVNNEYDDIREVEVVDVVKDFIKSVKIELKGEE